MSVRDEARGRYEELKNKLKNLGYGYGSHYDSLLKEIGAGLAEKDISNTDFEKIEGIIHQMKLQQEQFKEISSEMDKLNRIYVFEKR